jgi:predicted TIM-barrel fold metal-dependent hydrolase
VARLDLHAHVLPEEYRKALPRSPDGSALKLPEATVEQLLAMLDRFAIDAAVISTGPPGAAAADPGQSVELARIANESIAACVRAHPDRLAGLAVLPLPDVDAALAELDHALDELDLDGVMLLTNVDGIYVGDPVWDALFEALDERQAYVFLHPVHGPYRPPLAAVPPWLCEFPFDTTRAAVQLMYSGTVERCSKIRFQLAHLGGAAPFLAHRIASLADREPQLAEQASAGALSYLARLWYDTGLSNNAIALASTFAAVPAEHVVFGTDWPYASLPATGNDPAPGLGLDRYQREQLDAANAAALVPRLVSRLG